MSNLDSFKTGTGLADEFDFEIREAVWAYDAKIGNGRVPLLKLSGLMDGAKEITEMWGAGESFLVKDGGKSIEHKDGPGKRVNNNSKYGRFLDAFVEIPGALELMEKRDGDALVASTWEGLTLHLVREVKKFKIDGEDVESQALLPRAIIGEGSTVAKTDAATAPNIPEPALSTLTAAAKSSGSFEEFIGKAYHGDANLTDAPYEVHVADGGDSGFYALNKG